MQNKEYSVLYTHQKTKKHKTWQDGSLLFQKSNNKVILYDDQKNLLDSLFIASGQLSPGMDLESDRYLISIEEEKISSPTHCGQQVTPANDRCKQKSYFPQPSASIKRKGFQPPRFIASEKRAEPDISTEPPDKKFKTQEDVCMYNGKLSQMSNKPSAVTRDQFFSLYSEQRHHSLEQKTNLSSNSTFNNQTTKNSTCSQNKRNSSQILALFSSSNNQNPQTQCSSSNEDTYSRTNTRNIPSKNGSYNLESSSVGVALNRPRTHHPDLIDKENSLQENTSPLFSDIGSGHGGNDSLFKTSKVSYSTTPYLEVSGNCPSDWDDISHNQIFPKDSNVPQKGDNTSVMDLFQVPDIDMNAEFNMDDKQLLDDFTNEFYTAVEEQDGCFSIQSEQEKSVILSNWRGSLTSNTVTRNAVVPAINSQSYPKSSTIIDNTNWSRMNQNSEGPSECVPSPAVGNVGFAQRVPAQFSTRKREPITSCPPTNNSLSKEPEAEVPTNTLPHLQSCKTSHDGFHDNLSRHRRIGLSKPGRSLCQQTSTKAAAVQHQDFVLRPCRVSGSATIQNTMVGELVFPSCEEGNGNIKPCRQVTLPVNFANVQEYRQTLKGALREHLNIILFELAETYHAGLRKVNIAQYSSLDQGTSQQERPRCSHGVATLRAVKKVGPNKGNGFRAPAAHPYPNLGGVPPPGQLYDHLGLQYDNYKPQCGVPAVDYPGNSEEFRRIPRQPPTKRKRGRLFYCCPGPAKSQCKLFKWANECKTAPQATNKDIQCQPASKPTLSTVEDITVYFKSQNVSLYCECHLVIKKKNQYRNKFGKNGQYRYSKKNLGCDGVDGKTSMYLDLSRREHSTAYSKDDIWIISSSLTFNKHSTFVAKSTYFGPFANGELEISPISGYSPSKWHSGDTVFALHGCNAGSELMCIDNIDNHVKDQSMPLLLQLLSKHEDSVDSPMRHCRQSTFVPPTRSGSRNLQISADFAFDLAEETIAEYHLNTDQAAALYDCAGMFARGDHVDQVPVDISLIHGVFGAGKSYLLAVMILYLVKLFRSLEQQPKILVSSTTNVAVDRILLGLLELGFEDFIRVGSVRKIAKQLLPYSIHGSGSSSEEIKELRAMLKDDLGASEKLHIRKSIEQQKQGGNKERLAGIPVVGVTCAACVFPCLDKMKFSVLLLDECSQMTEPATLLPLARFGCQKLVLVGDPKQLSPTIQGSHSEHDAGLEQTLFNRLVKMGYKTTLLRTQYRCHPVISAVANRLFYDGNLRNGVSKEDRAPLVKFAPTLCFYDVTHGKEKYGQDGSYYNEEEAKFIIFLIGCFMMSGLEPSQIGVITLYKSQLRTISSCLTQSGSVSYKHLKSVQISTVDAFQGGEKDVILLSCVRTDHVGFIDCDRRTNVALTRAKRHLLIVGNQRMLSSNKMWRNVIQHCEAQAGGVVMARHFQESWQNDLDTSPDTKENQNNKTTPSLDQTEAVTIEIIEDNLNEDNQVESLSLDGSDHESLQGDHNKESHGQLIDDSPDMLSDQREEFDIDDDCLLSLSPIICTEKLIDASTHDNVPVPLLADQEDSVKDTPQSSLCQQFIPKSGHSSTVMNSEEFSCPVIPESSLTDQITYSDEPSTTNKHDDKDDVDLDCSSKDIESSDISPEMHENNITTSAGVLPSMGDEGSDDELPFFDILSSV